MEYPYRIITLITVSAVMLGFILKTDRPVAEPVETTVAPTAAKIETPVLPEAVAPEQIVATPTSTTALTPAEPTPTTQEITLPTYTKETLAQYDGENPDRPIYIAFEGNVYDVTAGKKFYEPGGAYHFLAGTDGTLLLRTFGGDLIKQKYPVVGSYLD